MSESNQLGNLTTKREFARLGRGGVTVELYERGFRFCYDKSIFEFEWGSAVAFAYSKVQHVANGVPQGLDCTWQLWDERANGNRPTVDVSFRIKPKWVKQSRGFLGIPFIPNYDLELPAPDPLLEQIALTLTDRISAVLAECLERDGRVMWSTDLAITTKGLQVVKKGKEGREILYSDIGQLVVGNGFYTVKMAKGMFNSLNIPTGCVNFFPGLLVFESIFETVTGRQLN